MPEYLAPGVFVEEVSAGPKPIEGVSTSVAGFLGPTERGPEYIKYITSFLEFQRWYGQHLSVNQSYMTHAVQGFFDNGGKRCFVGRIVNDDAPRGTLELAGGNLNVSAIGRGTWAGGVYIRVRQASKALKGIPRAEKWIRVQIAYYRNPPEDFDPNPIDPFDPNSSSEPGFRDADLLEDFDDLSHLPNTANNILTTINAASKLIRLEWDDGFDPATLETFELAPDFQPLTADGQDATPAFTDYIGDLGPIDGLQSELIGSGRGLRSLSEVDEVSLLLAPDEVRDENLTSALVRECEKLRDRFAVLSTPRNFPTLPTPQQKPSQDTTYGAQYFPWIRIFDPEAREDVLVPPAGHVAGLIARTDIDRGVFKAPANAVLRGAKELQVPVTKQLQELLNPVGINCIRDFRSDGRGIRVWGARTMSSDPEWKYVNVRRLFLFVEESIDEGIQWVVFEPNYEETWARVVRTISAFLTTVWRAGGLQGVTQAEAFFVKCDRTTMTQDDIDNGRLICVVGIAPVKPAEFVIIRIGQKTLEAQG